MLPDRLSAAPVSRKARPRTAVIDDDDVMIYYYFFVFLLHFQGEAPLAWDVIRNKTTTTTKTTE